MLNKPLLNIICISLCMYATASYAGFAYTSKDLKTDCEEAIRLDSDKNASNVNTLRVGSCYGYMDGVIDTQTFFAWVFAGKKGTFEEAKKYFLFCINEGVTRVQIATIVVKYLNDHPDELQHSPASTIIASLMDAYPCKSDDKKDNSKDDSKDDDEEEE